jgi:hypothetical protein
MQNSTLFQGTPEGLVELMLIGFRAELKAFKESFVTAPADELVLTEQACEILKVKPITLYRWQKQGRINVYKIGKINYYKKAELMDCLILSK